jgi:hypothetical protein
MKKNVFMVLIDTWVKLHLSGYPLTIEVSVPPALLDMLTRT